jgi:preprotein translocase subunit YajC
MANLIPLALLGVIYVFLFLPQQRKAKAHRGLVASIGDGDEVFLECGIHGFVGAVEDNVIWLEVADGVELKVNRASIAARVDPADSSSEDDDSDE